MKTLLLGLLSLALAAGAAEPKRILVVSATAGFRHQSIENGEKLLRQLAEKSGGEFTVVLMSDDPDYPKTPLPGGRGGGGPRGGMPAFPGQVPTASPEQQAALTAVGEPISPLNQAADAARNALASAVFNTPSDAAAIKTRLEALSTAEAALASARADGLAKLQAGANKLTPEQLLFLAGNPPAGARGGGRGGAGGFGGGAPADPRMAKVFENYMSAAALRKYDGIFMVHTTGSPPIPDIPALLDWVAAGHAYMGIHAALDSTLPDPYVEMFGGGVRFLGHPGGGTIARKIVRVDKTHPTTKDWPDGMMVVDEFYQFRNFDRAKVHSLLDMDFEGELKPVAWVKTHDKGRVFYTSLGHRDDVLLPDTASRDYGNSKVNPNEVSTAYQKHVVQGIRWALGLIDGDAAPNPPKP